jgi:hypothetical protein
MACLQQLQGASIGEGIIQKIGTSKFSTRFRDFLNGNLIVEVAWFLHKFALQDYTSAFILAPIYPDILKFVNLLILNKT